MSECKDVITFTVAVGQICSTVASGRVDSVDYSVCTVKEPDGYYTGKLLSANISNEQIAIHGQKAPFLVLNNVTSRLEVQGAK